MSKPKTEEQRLLKNATQRVYYAKNRERLSADQRARGQKNKEQKRHYDRSKRYGMTLEEASKVDSVKFCQATGLPLGEGKGKVVDHSHKHGHVRGVLDSKINKAIGLFGDDPATLRAAADYLERTSAPGYDWRSA